MEALHEARAALDRFLKSYLTDRDLEAAADCLSAELYSVGTGAREVARSREEFKALLREEFAANPDPFHLEWKFLDGKCAGDCADFLGQVRIFGNLAGEEFSIEARFTAVMRREDGVFKAAGLHMSTASETQEEKEFFPVRFAEKAICEIRGEMEHKALEMLTDSIPGGMMGGYLKKGWPLYFINSRMLGYLGFTHEEFVREIGGMVINCIHPDDRERVEKTVGEGIARDNQYEVQYRMCRKGGGYLWILDKGSRIRTPEGRDAILSVCVDITESVRLRMELEEKSARLEENNRELRRQQYFTSLLMSSNTMGMLICYDDPSGSFAYVGENLIRFLGYEEGEFKSRFSRMKELIAKEDWEAQRDAILEQLAAGDFYRVEYCVSKKDGTRLWVQEQGQRSVEASGRSVFVCTLLDISQHKQRQAQLERASERDALTGVYNRGAGIRRIKDYLAKKPEEEGCALLMLDLDNFKRVNDTFGHMTGDQVLLRLGEILLAAFRKSDLVTRLGGDEFVVLMKDVRGTDDLERKAEDVCRQVREAMDSRIRLLGLSVSIGIALGKAGAAFEGLYQMADEALYVMKCKGKDGYCILPEPDLSR